MKTIVAKFGGSSLADAAQFRKVRAIIESDPQRRFIVASAPGRRSANDVKVTDLLYECQALAARHADPTPVLDQITARFTEIIEDLGIEFDLQTEMAIIRSRLRERDYMASRGEYLNSKILAAYLGVPFYDAAESVRFLRNGRPDYELTNELLASALSNVDRAVVPGFYGADASGVIRTFSRGGSDVTGSLVARAVGADLYENWTDVSGMLFADPRVVKDPRPVAFVTYRELRELSYMGASVLHEDAVFPVRKAGIPINIRNTNRPADAGTMIVPVDRAEQSETAVTGVAGRPGFACITVEKGMMNGEIGFGAKLLTIFAKHGISFEHCPSGIDTMSVVVASAPFEAERDAIFAEIEKELRPDHISVDDSIALIAVVGHGMMGARGISAKVFHAMHKAGVNVRLIDQGPGEMNIILGVAESDLPIALQELYNELS
ncbi:MAG: aspartate kinase [Oscillospiraceae bacterium]|nr:aspartate kinase [Oscillospiraceae bacterium]